MDLHRARDAESGKSKENEYSATFEEAVTRTGFGKFNCVLMLGCAMGQFGVVFQLYITSYLLPSIERDFRISVQEKGFLTSVSYVGVILGSYLWGLLADTKGRKRVLVITLMLDAICGLLSSLAPNFYVFLALRLLNGFFICCPAAVVFPYFGEFFNSKNRPPAIMAVTCYLPLGLIILPGIAWLIIPQPWSVELPWCDYNSWRIFVAVCSLPSAIGCLLMTWVLPESPKYLFVHQEEARTLKVLRRMYAMNTGNKEDIYAVKHLIPDEENVAMNTDKSLMTQLKNMWFKQTLPLFKMPHIPRTLLFSLYQFGVYACCNSLTLWLPVIFNNMASFTMANGRYGTICEAMDAALLGQNANRTTQLALPNNLDTLIYWPGPSYNVSNNMEGIVTSTSIIEDPQFIEAATCEVTINPETFVNSLIISTAMVFLTIGLGVALRWIKQKPLMYVWFKKVTYREEIHWIYIHWQQRAFHLFPMPNHWTAILIHKSLAFLATTFCCLVAMNLLQDDTAVLVLICLFFCMGGSCASLMISAGVDLFPTHLRAMAVCLGLMMARAGVVVGTQVIAALIEYSCPSVFYIAAGTFFVCGVLAFLLPDTKKGTQK